MFFLSTPERLKKYILYVVGHDYICLIIYLSNLIYLFMAELTPTPKVRTPRSKWKTDPVMTLCFPTLSKLRRFTLGKGCLFNIIKVPWMSLWALARLQMDQTSKKANGPNPNDMGFSIISKRHCSWEALIRINTLYYNRTIFFEHSAKRIGS